MKFDPEVLGKIDNDVLKRVSDGISQFADTLDKTYNVVAETMDALEALLDNVKSTVDEHLEDTVSGPETPIDDINATVWPPSANNGLSNEHKFNLIMEALKDKEWNSDIIETLKAEKFTLIHDQGWIDLAYAAQVENK